MRDGIAARDRTRRRRLAVVIAALVVAGAAGEDLDRWPAPAAPLRGRLPGRWLRCGRIGPSGAPDARRRSALLALPARLPRRTIVLPILMYHRIDALLAPTLPSITRRLTVAPADFAAQMNWLRRHGYYGVTQLQAFNALIHGARLAAAAGHDHLRRRLPAGRSSLWRAPVLVRLRLPATEYVITDRISGPDTSFLTWGQLERLQQRRHRDPARHPGQPPGS